MNGDSNNNETCQQEPQSEEKYVILPGHPFYGQRFRVLSRRDHKTYIRCVIENPQQPGFHYHIMERWLSSTPPQLPAEPSIVIALQLCALDKMVQMVLTITQRGRVINDATAPLSTGNTDLESNANTKPTATARPALPSNIEASGRNK